MSVERLEQEAKRWLSQAKDNLEAAETNTRTEAEVAINNARRIIDAIAN